MLTEQRFYSEAVQFLELLFQDLKAKNVILEPQWEIDHLCYRADSEDSYQNLKSQISSYAKLLIESPVNGRLISTFELQKPVRFEDFEIYLVELPAPKKGKVVASGFEHVEVVCDQEFEVIKKKYPQAEWNEGGRKKVFNPELEMVLGSRNLKFHHLSLESVIRFENQTKIYKTLMNSEILTWLQSFTPQVVGTFPLGLQVKSSDVDIVCSVPHLSEFKSSAERNWGHHKRFQITEPTVNGKPAVFFKLEIEDMTVEVLAQNQPATQQVAFLHFQIEERIMRHASARIIQKIRDLRASQKTEPAFAQALLIDGDPFAELLKLQKWSRKELKSFLAAKA